MTLRSPSFTAFMGRLALLAMLLMIAAPGVTRALGGARVDLLAGTTELCTSAGIKTVDLTLFAGGQSAKPMSWSSAAPAPVDGHHAGGHCPYCPMLSSVTLLVPWVALLPPQSVPTAWPPAVVPLESRVAGVHGLGSRGPPTSV